MTPRVQGIFAVGMCALWALVLVLRVTSDEPLQEVPLLYKTGQRPTPHAAGGAAQDEWVVKPLTPQGQGAPATPQKNIFVMGPAHEPRETVEPAGAGQRTVRAPKAVVPVVPVAPPIESPPPPPPIPVPVGPTPEELAAIAATQERERLMQEARVRIAQYRYLGYARRDGQHQAFVGKGTDIYILRQGDKLEAHLVVAGIDPTAVTLREDQTNLEGRIELKPNQSGGAL